MTNIEARIINFKKAVRNNKPKNFVRYKFLEYMKLYNDREDEPSIKEKIDHGELFRTYTDYMKSERRTE